MVVSITKREVEIIKEKFKDDAELAEFLVKVCTASQKAAEYKAETRKPK